MNTAEIRRHNLKAILQHRFAGNQTALATAIDRSTSYIWRCLNDPEGKNHKPIGEKFARHVEKSLNLMFGALDTAPGIDTPERRSLLDAATIQSEEALERGPAMLRAFRTTKIVGTAQLGPEGYWDALTSADGWLDVPTNDPDAYSLRVKGESMAPAIRSGWAVWCEPNHPLIPGEYVMVRRTNGECMVKELLYENQTEVSLMAVNVGYGRLTIPREEVEQIHYVGGIVPPSRIRY